MKGSIWLNEKATFVLGPLDGDETEVTAKLVTEGMAPLMKVFLSWRVKSYPQDSLNRVEEILRKWIEC